MRFESDFEDVIRCFNLTRISGVTWDEAWKGREALNCGKQQMFVIGKRELLANKAATGRTKDKADWEHLQHDVGQKRDR